MSFDDDSTTQNSAANTKTKRKEGCYSVLPFNLFLASISLDGLHHCMRPLIHNLFIKSGPSRFISYTETQEEISLILDEESLRDFLQPEYMDFITECNSCWRAININSKSTCSHTQFDTTEIASRYSNILAKHNISIMFLSTFESEIILVEDQNLDAALEILATDREFNSTNAEKGNNNSNETNNNGDDNVELSDTDPHVIMPINNTTSTTNLPGDVGEADNVRMHLTTMNHIRLRMCSFQSRESFLLHMKDLLELFFYGRNNNSTNSSGRRFLSYTAFSTTTSSSSSSNNNNNNGNVEVEEAEAEEEEEEVPHITLVCDADILDPTVDGGWRSRERGRRRQGQQQQQQQIGIHVEDTVFKPVHINEGALGFVETGIVASLSVPLARASIPILYFSTFLTEYALVPETRLEEAIGCLKDTFTLLTDEQEEEEGGRCYY